MKRHGVKVFFLISFVLLLTGCWNNRPLKNIGINAAIGLDNVEGNKIEFSVQLVKPSALAAEQSKAEKAFIFASNISDTLHSAGRNLFTTYLNKTIYIDHVQLVVISEEMAKHGISDVLDFWERDFEANFNAIIVITKGVKAKIVLQAESEMEPIPTLQIVKSIKNTVLTSEGLNSSLLDCISTLNSKGAGLALGMIQFKEGSDYTSLSDIDLRGAAVFKGAKLAGFIGPNDVKSLSIVKNKAKGGLFEVPNPFENNEVFNYEMVGASSKMEIKIQDELPQFTLKVQIAGGISELHGERPPFTETNLNILEDAAAAEIKSMIQRTIELSKNDFNSDIFGFGQELDREYPDCWEKIKENWDQIYKTLPINVEVKVSINEFGRIYESNETT